MILYFLIGICIIIFFFIVWKLHSLENFYSELYNKYFIDSNNTFINKIDTIFNRILVSKDEDTKRIFHSIDPITRVIDELKKKIEDIEKNRSSNEQSFKNSINSVIDLQKNIFQQTSNLKDETGKMMNAFKNPNFRGHWGEVHLKRVVEIAGMIPYCDFNVQVRMGEIRPDMVINLPNGGIVIVDAKTPMEAFLKFYNNDSTEAQFKKDNIDAFKSLIKNLSDKQYWVYGKSPEFVIMYIPTESLWIQAISADNSLFEFATEKNVIIATPMTLIALLKTIAFGWSQLKLAEDSEKLKQLLHEVRTYCVDIRKVTQDTLKNFSTCGKNLTQISEMLTQIEHTIVFNNFAAKDNMSENLISKKNINSESMKEEIINKSFKKEDFIEGNFIKEENINNEIMKKEIVNKFFIEDDFIEENFIKEEKINENLIKNQKKDEKINENELELSIIESLQALNEKKKYI